MTVLPCYLPQIAERIPIGHPWRDITLIVRNHTSLPYFIYFDNEDDRKRYLARFAGTSLSHLLCMSLGLLNNRCKAWSIHPRYCSTCVEENNDALGFSLFRREHQLPGVAVCWRHGTVLAQGCNHCGPYPIKRRALSMAGKCYCNKGIDPLPADPTLPADKEPLLWLARQSATLVNASGTSYVNIRATLREIVINKGFGRGSLPKLAHIAEAIERRFGNDTLEWLGTPVWKNGLPAAWISRLLMGQLHGQRRSATILFLLVIGSLYESVEAFEKTVVKQKEKTGTKCANFSLEAKDPPPDWSNELFRLLQTSKCGLPGISHYLGIPIYKLIKEIRRHDWRVVLSQQIRKKLGDETISTIKYELWCGIEKKDIMRRYGCSEWTMALIELDEPGLHDHHRNVVKLTTREENRARLLEHLALHPTATRKGIEKDLPGVYSALIKQDKDWLQKQISKKKVKTSIQRKERVEWSLLDQQKHLEITKIFNKMFEHDRKPVRATATAVLKQVQLMSKYNNTPRKFPLVSEILQKRSESYADFIRRRITWAVEQMATKEELISINKLRRVAGLQAQTLRSHKQLIIDIVQRLNNTINGQ